MLGQDLRLLSPSISSFIKVEVFKLGSEEFRGVEMGPQGAHW